MAKLATPLSQYIDGALFVRYYPLIQEEVPFSVFGAHPAHIEQEHTRFVENGYTYLPNLRPSKDDVAQLATFERKLTALNRGLRTSMPDTSIRNAYHWRIHEDLADLRMVLAAATGDISKFRGYNLFLYGSPNKNTFKAVCDWFVYEAEKARNDQRPEVSTAAAEIISALEPSRGNRDYLIPNHTIFRGAREREYGTDGFLYRLLRGITFPPGGIIDAQSGDKILREMLANLNCSQKLEDAVSWSVTTTALKRPATYRMTTQEFIEYVAHEFRHVIEYRDGLASKLELTATGLDHYSLGNEGRGVVTEQITNKTFEAFTKQPRWYELLGRHLTVSLSCGLAGKNKNFVESYRIIRNVQLVYEANRPNAAESNMDEILQHASDQAWDLLVSVYEGTDGSGRGGGWRRPMIYLEGSVALWHKESTHPGAIELGDIGKFDVNNPRHIKILKKAGILGPGIPHASYR